MFSKVTHHIENDITVARIYLVIILSSRNSIFISTMWTKGIIEKNVKEEGDREVRRRIPADNRKSSGKKFKSLCDLHRRK